MRMSSVAHGLSRVLLVVMSLPVLASQGNGADWEATGRPLPTPGRQPPLDPRLPTYVPCPVEPRRTLVGTAPAVLPDLVLRWTAAFAGHAAGVEVVVPPPYGSPQGSLNGRLREFLQGSGDFAFLSRTISDADLATFREARGHAPRVVPVAAGSFSHFGFVDPVVVVVNDANPARVLSVQDLRRILAADVPEVDRPHDWTDVGVSAWSGRGFRVAGGADWHKETSARGLVIRERLLAGSALRTDLGEASGAEADVPARVAADPAAIGFTGLGHMVEGIHALAIPGPDGKGVAPTFDNVAQARYPLARTVDLVLAASASEPLEPAMAEWVRFLLSREGQAVVREQGVFLPLTAAQAIDALQRLGLSGAACRGRAPAAAQGPPAPSPR